MATYLFITQTKYVEDVPNPWKNDRKNDRWWSCSKATEAGDTALVYIVGVGIKYELECVSDAVPHEEWRYICDVEFRRKIDPPIDCREICETVTKGEWAPPHLNFRGYRSLLMPDKIAERIHGLRPARTKKQNRR